MYARAPRLALHRSVSFFATHVLRTADPHLTFSVAHVDPLETKAEYLKLGPPAMMEVEILKT